MVGFIDNFILGISLTLPLGPITLEILRRGLRSGFYEALRTTAGSFGAELTYFTIVYMGLARFSSSPFVTMPLGLLGAAFLLWIGYANIRDFFSKTDNITTGGLYKNPFVSGYLVTFLNPSNFFMWAGIIGGLFAQNTSLFVSSGVLLGVFLSLFGIAMVSNFGRKVLGSDKMKYVSLAAGLFLTFYGLRLLYTLVFR